MTLSSRDRCDLPTDKKPRRARCVANKKNLVGAGRSIVEQVSSWAEAGQSAPSRLLGGARGFVEWAHYPQPDAIDPESGWRFYYHAHPAGQRLANEHGHFHIFVPGPEQVDAGQDRGFSHLIGLSVDEKGLPLRLFTTNRWVTGETWRPATELVGFVEKPALSHAEPKDVAQWLANIIILFGDEIRALILARDQRFIARTRPVPPDPQEDRRLRLPSQCRISLAQRIQKL